MKLIIYIVLGLLNSLPNQQINDSVNYAKVTYVRTYMNVDRTSVSEFWITRDKSCTVTRQMKTLVRRDLGVYYVINLQAKTYRVDSLNARPPQEASSKNTTDLKHIGFEYAPTYEWRERKLMNSKTVDNYPCEHFLFEGEADFDRISLDCLITKTEDESLATGINSFFLSYTGNGNKRDPLIELTKNNKNLLILSTIEKVENPIAPPITTTVSVNSLEKIFPDEGLFEIPSNFKKIN